MSLKEFLAVGRSFAGSPREKSPFEMRKDVRLPTFENAPRFSARQPVIVQTDWLEEKAPTALPSVQGIAMPATKGPAKTKKRSWLSFLALGLWKQPQPSGALVQSEMHLEKVRVLRNDLSDSDLEVVVKKDKFAMRPVKAAPIRETSPTANTRKEWSELSARLFEIGQQ